VKIAIFLLTLLTFNSTFGQDWKPNTYVVKFKLKMLGIGVNGKFNGLKVKLNSAEGVIKSISATVDANTVNTDNNLRDKHLKEKPEFFQVDKFSTLSLISTQITKGQGNAYTGTFNLTIKDVSKAVKIPFTVDDNGESAVMKANFNIDRKTWNFGGDTPGMGDKVEINLTLNLKK
jgi:polyisoprenoid-binding protein YceI